MSGPACDRARAAMHARLDGDLDPHEGRALDAHLAACAACREAWSELAALAEAFAAIPAELPLPDADLEAVFARTIVGQVPVRPGRAQRPAPTRSVRRRRALLAAAAAVFGALVLLPSVVDRFGEPPPPTATDVARARAELRLVMDVTGRALDTGRRAAVDGALRPAFARVPLLEKTLRPAPEEDQR